MVVFELDLRVVSLFSGLTGTIYACIQMLGGAAGSGMISFMTHYGQPQECLGILIILQGIVGVIFTRQLLHKNQTFTE
jgi:hypothetical protein